MRGARLGAAVALASIALAAPACLRDTPPPADGRTATWLDLSPSFDDPPRDPGDALALLQAYGSGRLAVRGVSVTFGNVPLVRGYPAAQELMARLDTGLLRPWRGASSPEERAAPTEATELLGEALAHEPLTIVALGPATTIASVLLRHPDAAARIERLVLVAGRRADAATDDAQPAPGDANVLADPGSMKVLLDSPAPITLVASALSAGIGIEASDLDRLEAARGAVRLVLRAARAWLQEATRASGGSAFAVPAMLAVDVAAHPGEMRCEAAMASLRSGEGAAAPALLVSGEPGAPGRRVTWCHTADAGARDRLLGDLLRVAPRR